MLLRAVGSVLRTAAAVGARRAHTAGAAGGAAGGAAPGGARTGALAAALAASVGLSVGLAGRAEAEDPAGSRAPASSLVSADFRTRVIGQYENRIRLMSAPEKIFNYFATVDKDGEMFMTPEDFVRSLTPYSFQTDESAIALNRKTTGDFDVPEFFAVADADGDGLVSFSEYIFFITLLSIPESDFLIAFRLFDEDGSGRIDKNEFSRAMDLLRARSAMASAERSGVATNDNKGLLTLLFGSDGSKSLSYAEFHKFFERLQTELLQLEFNLYDKDKKGYLNARTFGHAIVAHAKTNDLSELVKRVDAINMPGVKITFDEFRRFHSFLKNIGRIDSALKLLSAADSGGISRSDFVHMVRAVADCQLASETLNIIWTIFDKDGDGKLDQEEFINVLSHTAAMGFDKPRTIGFLDKLSCCAKCITGSA